MSERVFGYLVIDVLLEPVDKLLEIPAGYVAPIGIGEVILKFENHGTGMHTLVQEDGPVKVVITGQYIVTGAVDGENSPVMFGLGEQRVLNLLSIGQHFEQVLRDQVHEFADRSKERIEEKWSKADDCLGDQVRAIDDLEKHFFDRKNR